MTGRIVTTIEGDVIDLTIWRETGRQSDTVEKVLAANPGLADRGVVLPAAVPVLIPDAAIAPPQRRYFKLWD